MYLKKYKTWVNQFDIVWQLASFKGCDKNKLWLLVGLYLNGLSHLPVSVWKHKR